MIRTLSLIKVIKENVLLIYPNGETNYLCYRDKELLVLPTNKDFEHDDPITSMDVTEH